MLTRIYINRHTIAANKKNAANDPPICISTYKNKQYCHAVMITGTTHLFYDQSDPICSGATAWLETQGDVRIIR